MAFYDDLSVTVIAENIEKHLNYIPSEYMSYIPDLFTFSNILADQLMALAGHKDFKTTTAVLTCLLALNEISENIANKIIQTTDDNADMPTSCASAISALNELLNVIAYINNNAARPSAVVARHSSQSIFFNSGVPENIITAVTDPSKVGSYLAAIEKQREEENEKAAFSAYSDIGDPVDIDFDEEEALKQLEDKNKKFTPSTETLFNW